MELCSSFYIFISFILVETVWTIPNCTTRTLRLPPRNLMNRNEESLFTTAIMLEIKIPDNVTEGCIVNTDKYIELFDLNANKESIAVFSFRCGTAHPIFLQEYSGKQMPLVFSYLQVRLCILGRNDIEQISKVVNLYVFSMMDSVIDVNKSPALTYSQNMSQCFGIENIYSVGFINPIIYNNSTSLDFLNCSSQFYNVAELSVTNQGLTELPASIKHKLPNLQTLELEMNNLTEPPYFPWNDQAFYLGNNLTRSSFFDDHYITPYHITVPSNAFRRYLNLNFNKIVDLRNFKFRGKLDMISLKQNGLKYIGEQSFTETRGLQSLDLSDNLLSFIPTETFQGLSHLRNLDLRNTTLKSIDQDHFRDLRNLINLDISSNQLESLPRKVFLTLESLQSLHLESNRLSFIPTESFPVFNLNFEEIRLENNPITVFPDVVLYWRNLKLADLRYTNINFDNVSALLENVSYPYLAESVGGSSSNDVNLDERSSETRLRRIDLSGSAVTRIDYNADVNHVTFAIILRNFEFVLDNTDLLCDCRITPFSHWANSKLREGVFSREDYFFKKWICEKPAELSERPMLSITEEETYCEIEVEFCPVKCICYEWSVSKIITVDCRNTSLIELPQKLPEGTLDLWFQSNNITRLTDMEYFKRCRDVLLSHNSITEIDDSIIKSVLQGDMLRKIYINSNYLATLPNSIQSLVNIELRIKDNPFVCDCKTLWMKKWMLTHQNLVTDWIDVVCAYGDGEGHQFITAEDDKFICLEAFDAIKHVVAPSIASSICVLLFIVAFGTGFIFRLELKVLIFIYFGVHPFDKDEKDDDEDIDCVIVHSEHLTEWTHKHIVEPLETGEKACIVCEMSRDFVVGFSYQENICSIVRRSKRMILVLSQDFLVDSDIVKIAWNEAQEKIKDMRTNYAIVICHEVTTKMIDNKDLKRYIKRGRYINSHDKLFIEKILYRMPQNVKHVQGKLPNIRQMVLEMYESADNTDTEDVHAFLTYSDRDVYVALKTLTPVLEDLNFTLRIPDRDFMPGASKEENVLKAIEMCRHTLFLLSGPYLEDEWSLFTFRSASEKSIRHKCNHMIVIVIDGHENEYMDEEVKHYLKTHVTLCVTDPWFWQKLTKALPDTNNHTDNVEILNNRINYQIYRQLSINNVQEDDENDINRIGFVHENEIQINNNLNKQNNDILVTQC